MTTHTIQPIGFPLSNIATYLLELDYIVKCYVIVISWNVLCMYVFM